ncbi:MAG TPA: hypothetical protein VNW92_08360 [Polyangiaceae bacterium]|jgi:hypothetical protein|nr:hypothetical protein [Polyangiaceae bacterium]
MLLFVLSDNFRELPEQPELPCSHLRADTRALFASGLFVALWCALRLLVARGEGFSVDVALAVPFLGVGLAAVLSAARDLQARHRLPSAELPNR